MFYLCFCTTSLFTCVCSLWPPGLSVLYRDGDKLAPSVQKKFDELEVNLLHLQQNIDIPEVQLVVNPEVLAAVKKAQAGGRKPDVGDFRSKVADSNFLNALQKDVNKWKTDIKKVRVYCRHLQCGGGLRTKPLLLPY